MTSRKPQAFRLDDPHVVLADDDTRAVNGTVRVVPEPEHFDLPARRSRVKRSAASASTVRPKWPPFRAICRTIRPHYSRASQA